VASPCPPPPTITNPVARARHRLGPGTRPAALSAQALEQQPQAGIMPAARARAPGAGLRVDFFWAMTSSVLRIVAQAGPRRGNLTGSPISRQTCALPGGRVTKIVKALCAAVIWALLAPAPLQARGWVVSSKLSRRVGDDRADDPAPAQCQRGSRPSTRTTLGATARGGAKALIAGEDRHLH